MALQKQNLNLNFVQGLDQKTDPFQLKPGKMQALVNTIFTKGGLLQKRNGFGTLPQLPDNTSRTVSTFAGNLVALGTTLRMFNVDDKATDPWINKGRFQPIDMTVIPTVRNQDSLTACDTAVAPNGLALVSYQGNNGTFWEIIDSATGQTIQPLTTFPGGTGNAIQPRTYVVGNFFILTWVSNSAPIGLTYIAIPLTTPNTPNAPVVLDGSTTIFTGSPNIAIYDAFVSPVNGSLYFASAHSNGVFAGALSTSLVITTPVSIAANVLNKFSPMSVTVDPSSGNPWVTFYAQGATATFAVQLNPTTLAVVTGPTSVSITLSGIVVLSTTVLAGTLQIFAGATAAASYSGTVNLWTTNYATVTSAGVATNYVVHLHSVVNWSRAFVINGVVYLGVQYTNQNTTINPEPTFFIVDVSGNVVAKIAYQNGPGSTGGVIGAINPMANVTIIGQTAYIAYLIRFQAYPLGSGSITNINPPLIIFAYQLGANLAAITFSNNPSVNAEIGNNLHIGAGFVWAYDGVNLDELNFHVYPEQPFVATLTTGGSILTGTYTYYVIWEWEDAYGNLIQSNSSLPGQVVVPNTTSTNSNQISIPNLALTYKKNVRISIFRSSLAQPIPYEITSPIFGTLNVPANASTTFNDTQADASILGNRILYTFGGILGNSGGPATFAMAAYNSRLFLITSEDRNTVWYSETVLQGTPVNFSPLQTVYVAPNLSSQQQAGPLVALGVMDDKLLLWKAQAIYYMTGLGPDATGANSDFSQPQFITSTVGCINKQSLVYTPQGVFFQSDKGMWLLGRDLRTNYIGAPVENFTIGHSVVSALSIPGTNQVRFIMDSGVQLMYDYYYGQWGSFSNIPGVSGCIYQSLHTFLSTDFQTILQETPGTYLDGLALTPTTMSFTTAWLNLAGLQSFERAYFFFLLGSWFSPHKLTIQVAYDYNPAIVQTTVITPDNNSTGNPVIEWQVFLDRQKCEAFQLTITESFDPTQGPAAGQGLTLSGLNIVIGAKKGYRTQDAGHHAG